MNKPPTKAHRQRTEDESDYSRLEAENQRFQRLLQSTTDYIFTVAVQDGRPTTTSHGPGCVTVTGYTSAEYESNPYLWYHMVHEKDRSAVTEQAAKILAGEKVGPLEHRIVHKDGAVRWVKSTLVARRDAQGRMVAYDGLISDITERKRAEGRQAMQHAVTRVLADSTSLDEATPKILQALCDNLGWDLGALWRVLTNADVLRCVAVWQQPSMRAPDFETATRNSTFPPGVGLPGRIWASAKPIWVSNVTAQPNFPRAQFAIKDGLHAACGFPIMLGNKILGAIEFFSRKIQPPDDDLLEMMAAIGSQIGQFIERKRTEEALAEERNLLRTLIDAHPDATYVKDTESRFLIGNLSVADLMGAPTPEELTGKRDSDFYPADLAQRYFADEQRIIQTGQPLINREEPAVDPSGKTHWLLTTKVPLRESSGCVVGIVGIGRDITDYKRVEAERDRFFTLSQDMLCIAGFNGWFKQLNPAWEQTLGFSKEELMAKPFLEFVHPDDRAATAQEMGKLAAGSSVMNFENRYLCKDGSYKWLLWSSCPFPEQQLVYAAAREITERKAYESELQRATSESARSEEALRSALADLKRSHQELKATQLQLIQTAKLESVGTLAAGVAHEVKNPLQIILMGVDYLAKNVSTDNQNIPAVLDDMRNAISRADRIVRGLLEFSAAYRPEVKDEDLNAIVDSSVALVRFEAARSHIEIKKLLADSLPPLKLDKTKIQQVFINIFMNAIHSMPQGGTLTVGTYIRRLTEIDYDVGDRNIGHMRVGDTVDFKVGEIAVVAEVEDTGTGIPEDKLAKIFDPFFTTKAAGKGTGLGLTVVKKIVELHGGSIDIRNRPEGGVIVTLVFKTWRT
jgi:PAS domain S-box-containing protein